MTQSSLRTAACGIHCPLYQQRYIGITLAIQEVYIHSVKLQLTLFNYVVIDFYAAWWTAGLRRKLILFIAAR